MNYFKDFSIKKKLILIQLLTTFTALLFYSVYHIVRDTQSFRDTVNRELTSIAEIIGSNCVSAIHFMDDETAEAILATLGAEDNIVNAWIRRPDGSLFARYDREGHEDFRPENPSQTSVQQQRYLVFSLPIRQNDETLGVLSLRYDLKDYRKILIKNVTGTVIIFLIGMAAAWVLSILTQRTISNPISHLLGRFKQVTGARDYSVRMEIARNDEIGKLAVGINEMLAEIEIHQNERDEAQSLLRESEARYRAIVEDQTEFVERWLPDGTITFLNESACKFFQRPANDWIGKNIYDTLSKSEQKRLRRKISSLTPASPAATDVYLSTLPNGHARWIQWTDRALFDASGEVREIQSVGHDITELRKAGQALSESEEKYRNLVERANDGIIILQDGVFKYVNPSLVKMSGSSEEELLGSHFADFVHEEEVPELLDKYRRRMAGEAVQSMYETRFKTAKGEIVDAEVNAGPITYRGEPADLVIIRNITERKQLERELRKHQNHLEELVEERTKELAEANTRLLELDRMKSMFLASMSHELRTPLNSIIGFTGLLLMEMAGELNPEQKKQLEMVKSSSNHLLDLINDILDISKIESGKVDLAVGSFDLVEVSQEVLTSVQPMADNKGLSLSIQCPDALEITSDRRRVKQILMNLVGNAVKFTEKGSVQIHVQFPDDRSVSVAVSDTGIGLKPEEIDKLFHPFQQIDMTSTKKYEGTGLGLYLSKKILTLLGGDISVQGESGRGSTFTFVLPLNLREESLDEKNIDH